MLTKCIRGLLLNVLVTGLGRCLIKNCSVFHSDSNCCELMSDAQCSMPLESSMNT